MKVFLSILVAALVFTMTAITLFGQGSTPKKAVANPTDFRKLVVRVQSDPVCGQKIQDCGRRILNESVAPDYEKNKKIRDEIFYFSSGVAVFLRTISGLADDSVEAIRYRLAFKKAGDGYSFVQAGVQQLCQRRRGSTGWTKQPCS